MSDIPEAKDLLDVLHGNMSERNFHRCFVLSKKMNQLTTSPYWTLSMTTIALLRYDSLKIPSDEQSVRVDVVKAHDLRSKAD